MVSKANQGHADSDSQHLMTGEEYRASLRDGRRILYRGEEVADVTTHPLFAKAVDMWADLYDQQFQESSRDLMTYYDHEVKARISSAWAIPRDAHDLEQRRNLLNYITDQTMGVYGRPPDYGPTLAMGFLSASHLFEEHDPDAADKIFSFIDSARRKNQLSTDVIADAQADRTRPPGSQPGQLHCVEETAEGIFVTGVKPAASAATIGHWGGIATLLSPGISPDAMIIGYVPVNETGLTFVARPATAPENANSEDNPIDSRGEEVDAFMFYERAFIPNERLFSFRNPDTLALYIDVALLPQWAILARMARRAQIFAATARMIVDILGTEAIPAVRATVAEVYAYAAALDAFVDAAQDKGQLTPHGVYIPNRAYVTAGRLYATTNLARITNILRELCGQGLVARVTAEDLALPEVAKWVDEYLPGNKVSGRAKNKFMNFVWDLTCSAQAARVALFENVNSTPPPAIRQQLYHSFNVESQRTNIEGHLQLKSE